MGGTWGEEHLFLQEVDEEFVLCDFKALKSTKSTGLDNIGPRFLNDGAEAHT